MVDLAGILQSYFWLPQKEIVRIDIKRILEVYGAQGFGEEQRFVGEI